MRTFILYRVTDVSGISGTGVVAEGVQFSDGVCCCRWLTATSTTTMYQNISDVESIHGHDGATKIIFEDALYGKEERGGDLA
jgi:hypothetical protein